MSYPFIDCQNLAGAFTLATVKEGFELVTKLSLPGGFGAPNVEHNRHLVGYDWDHQEAPWQDWESWREVPYVTGTPPCSGFSLLNRAPKTSGSARGPESAINDCMWALARYAGSRVTGWDGKRGPEVVAFESVQAAGKQGLSLMRALRDEIERLSGRRYDLYLVFMSGATVGAAQVRKRFFFVASRVPFGIEPPRVRRVVTYEDAIGDLRGQQVFEDLGHARKIHRVPSDFAKKLRRPDSYVTDHTRPLNPHALRTEAMARRGWPQGMYLEDFVRNVWWPRWKKMPEPWYPRNKRPKILGGPIRLRPDRCGYVVTGAGGFPFVHWEEDRILTVRECSRLMGFPDTWMWDAATSPSQAFMWVGKQIPIQSGRWLSRWVRRALDGDPGGWTGEETGERERTIDVTEDYRSVYNPRTGEQPVDDRPRWLVEAMERRREERR